MKRYIPGTDPLDGRYYRYTEAERDELVARAREAGERARSTAWRRRGEGGRFLPDDPEVS